MVDEEVVGGGDSHELLLWVPREMQTLARKVDVVNIDFLRLTHRERQRDIKEVDRKKKREREKNKK